MPNNELQELLSARFEEHTHPTNEAVWSAIEAQLDEEKSDRVGFWFWIFNGFAATILLGTIIQSAIPDDSISPNQLQFTEETFDESTNPKVLSKEKAGTDTPSNHNESSITNSYESTKIEDQGRQKSKVVHANNSSNHLPNVTNDRIVQWKGSPIGIENVKNEVSSNNQPTKLELPVDKLPYREQSNSPVTAIINHSTVTASHRGSSGYFKRLPIHIGAEFTYLHKGRTVELSPTVLDSDYTYTSSELAKNRHFELNLFSQFDFTNRFSAAIGIGYSSSKYESKTAVVSISSSSSTTTESELHLITIPLQTKFTILKQGRFTLNTGLTFQGEFGRINHFEQNIQDSWTLTSPQLEDESLTQNQLQLNFKQFALEPYLQFAVNISPRISTFTNIGYRTYFNQSNPIISLKPLNYFNAGVGLQFRLR